MSTEPGGRPRQLPGMSRACPQSIRALTRPPCTQHSITTERGDASIWALLAITSNPRFLAHDTDERQIGILWFFPVVNRNKIHGALPLHDWPAVALIGGVT